MMSQKVVNLQVARIDEHQTQSKKWTVIQAKFCIFYRYLFLRRNFLYWKLLYKRRTMYVYLFAVILCCSEFDFSFKHVVCIDLSTFSSRLFYLASSMYQYQLVLDSKGCIFMRDRKSQRLNVLSNMKNAQPSLNAANKIIFTCCFKNNVVYIAVVSFLL